MGSNSSFFYYGSSKYDLRNCYSFNKKIKINKLSYISTSWNWFMNCIILSNKIYVCTFHQKGEHICGGSMCMNFDHTWFFFFSFVYRISSIFFYPSLMSSWRSRLVTATIRARSNWCGRRVFDHPRFDHLSNIQITLLSFDLFNQNIILLVKMSSS